MHPIESHLPTTTALRYTRRALSVMAAILLATTLVSGCGEESKAPPTGEKVSATTNGDTPKVAPEMAAKLAVMSGKLACILQQHPEGPERERAQTAVFESADIDRDSYETAVKDLAQDAVYLASVKQAATMCGAGSADPSVAAAKVMRSKLKALAVASQCMAKQGKSGEEMNQVMMAQYRAYDITMSDYAREMAKLTNDRPFQDEVRRAVEACPGAPAPPSADAEGEPDAPGSDNAGSVGAEQATDAVENADDAAPNPAVGDTASGDGVVAADSADQVADDVEETPSEDIDEGSAGNGELPGTDAPPVRPDKPAGPNYSGTWTGTFKGGRMTIRVRGRRITATVIGGATRLTAKGSISGSRVSFSARRAQTYAKFSGKIKGTKMSGRVMATLNIGGSLRPVRGGWTARKK